MVDRRPLLSGKGTGERAGRGRGECGLLGAPPTGKPTVLGGTAKLLGRASRPGAAAASWAILEFEDEAGAGEAGPGGGAWTELLSWLAGLEPELLPEED